MRSRITLIQVLFVCVFVGCGIFLFGRCHARHKFDNDMKNLQNMVYEDSGTEERDEDGMLVRYRQLYDMNNDMVGWLRVEGTNIDYPVMYKNDSNAYYLHRNFERQKSDAGMLFLDYQCAPIDNCTNLIIYGHNMKNGTMFHELLSYKDKEFWEQNRYINFDTMYNRCRYEIFAVFRTEPNSESELKYYEYIYADGYDDFNDFIGRCINSSLYSTGIGPVYGDQLLMLSTCSYNSNDERFVVAGKRVYN